MAVVQFAVDPRKQSIGEGFRVERDTVLRALNVSSRTQAVLAVSQMSQKHGGFSTWRGSNAR